MVLERAVSHKQHRQGGVKGQSGMVGVKDWKCSVRLGNKQRKGCEKSAMKMFFVKH